MYANQERVVRHLEPLKELGVAAELLCEDGALFRTELELFAAIDQVEVLGCLRILTRALLKKYSTDGATLEVVGLVNIFMGWEEVVKRRCRMRI
jgi:hypothetical protein